MWRAGFRVMRRYPELVWLPFLLDLIIIAASWNWWGSSGVNSSKGFFHFFIPVGMPSIGNVAPILTPGGAHFIFPGYGFWAGLALLLFIVVQSYIQGGYIGWLHRAIVGYRLNWQSFSRHASANFAKFLLIRVLLLVFVYVYTMLLSAMMGTFGFAVVIFTVLAFRLHYILFEFTMVVDNRAIVESLVNSRRLIRQDWKRSVFVVSMMMLAVNLLFFVVQSLFFTFLLFVLLALAYNITFVALQVALMKSYERVRR